MNIIGKAPSGWQEQDFWAYIHEELHGFGVHVIHDEKDYNSIRLRHESYIDEEWERDKRANRPTRITFTTGTLLINRDYNQEHPESIEVDFMEFNMEFENCEKQYYIAPLNPHAAASMLYNGW